MIFSMALRYDPCDVSLEQPPKEDSPVLTTRPFKDAGTCGLSTVRELLLTPGELFNDDKFVEKLELMKMLFVRNHTL